MGAGGGYFFGTHLGGDGKEGFGGHLGLEQFFDGHLGLQSFGGHLGFEQFFGGHLGLEQHFLAVDF